MDNTRPNSAELLFLNLSYNRFYDLFEKVFEDDFETMDPYLRLCNIKDAFSIYSELLSYEPIANVISEIKTKRPPMESEIGSELFKFIRNVLNHFPLFEEWNAIWINKPLVNWHEPGLTIDKYLEKNLNAGTVKYRFWQENKKKMTYIKIKFPQKYGDEKIFHKDIISEIDGIRFSMILMKRIIDTQVINS